MAKNSTNQVFQTDSPSRWLRFKWSGRFLLIFLIFAVIIITIAMSRVYTPDLPQFASAQEKQTLLDTNSSFARKSKIFKQYTGFRRFITEKEAYNGGAYPIPKRFRKKNGVIVQADSSFYSFKKFTAGIRAAFYVSWDPESLSSLRQNISHINVVFPEWFFLDPNTDTLIVNIDTAALNIMNKASVKVLPILTNNFKQSFRGDVVHRIFTDRKKKELLISSIIAILKKYGLDGINIDFEELKEPKSETFVLFMKELYQKLHAQGFLVTQDVAPFNDDYDLVDLSKYNDYICLMAYDQFSESTKPGPICHQKWIEAAVDQAAQKIPPRKLILAIAGFGYDWRLDKEEKADSVNPIKYQQALTLARSYDGSIDFDNDSYNLHFKYSDEKGADHEVHFTDAATTFNTLRFAVEYGLSGVSLWRLGSEDSRMWDFYDRDMSKDSIKRYDFSNFNNVRMFVNDETPAYSGQGEVLDILGGPTSGKIKLELDSSELLISEEKYDTLPSKWVARKYGTLDKKKLVLTFDDGPDPIFTPEILDILSREKVPAVFFVVGINAENNIPIIKRIFREGHEIGNHTFTHPNIAKVGRKRAVLEIESTRLLLECITGRSTVMFRAPYNADFEPTKAEELIPVAIARQLNYLDIGESLDPLDWEPGATADSIVARVIKRKDDMTKQDLSGNIILLHDAGGDSREETVKALPQIIHYFRARGYTFTTIADLLGKKKDDLMPEVPKGSGYYILQINYYLAETAYWGSHILFSLFVLFIILSIGRIIFLGAIATQEYYYEKNFHRQPFWLPDGTHAPLVSIIVPAYNEEVNAVSSVKSLLNCDYPNFEIIFVDDGSKDNTYQKVNETFADNKKVKVFTKPNGGKASALNYGIRQSGADFVVCIDADTKLLPDAISKMMMHFTPGYGDKVGAVAGNVKVGNQVNLLTKWQSIEYISSQNFDRRAFSYINAITVVPGAIGAFRKKAIEEAGGFTTDTLAEDCDLTIRILRKGYVIDNDNKAIAMTEAPETLKMFLKQRSRWSFGVMQTFWKNRDALFSWKYKWLGWAAMPNILVFQYIIPSIIPLADFFMIIGLFADSASRSRIGKYYLVFMLVDVAVAILAFVFEKEKISKLVWLIPQRLVWRWLLWYVLYRTFRKAIKGELQHWGVLKRTGNVKDVAITTD
ncbi:MAG TPA: glycosyltransferase [Puia sp.]|nr:glycosyltransferase [Puia sp.]